MHKICFILHLIVISFDDKAWMVSFLQILQNPVHLSSKPDVLCNAVMEAAMSLTGKTFLPHTNCCAHCKGEIYDI